MANYALITGGLGFIGSFIARELIKKNIVNQVVLLDHYGRYVSSSQPDFFDYRKLRLQGIRENVIIERGEAKYANVLSRIITKYMPKYVFHLAALPLAKLDNINTEEAMDGSILSSANIFEICYLLRKHHEYKPDRIVYASSSMVYGDFQYDPADEEHPTRPKEIYGTMKLAGEIIVKGLSQFYGINSTIIRPSAVYGPTDMNRRVSQIFLEKAMKGQKITVYGEDEQLDFTYIKDISKGFVLAATNPNAVNEVFNITNGNARTLLEYVLELKKYFPDLIYEIIKRDAFRPKRGTLSIKKAEKLLGFKPDYDLSKGVKEYIEFVKLNNPVIVK